EDPAEQVTEDATAGATGTARGRAAGQLAADALGQPGQHDRGEDRQELLDEVVAGPAGRAEAVHHDVGVVAEDVADDLAAVLGVDLVEVHAAVDDGGGLVLAQRPGQGLGALRILRVELHTSDEGGQQLAHRLLRL